MKIYFSCSLTGGREDEEIYGMIVNHLLSQGHEIPTAHLAQPEVMALEQVVDAREVYLRDMRWVDECDALIAEVSTPSHGVGYEIAYALSKGKPVMCCYRQDVGVSKMIIGNDAPTLTLGPYTTAIQAMALVDRFMEQIEDW
jgi:nucleoside 2-deoxyribosyltransferase